MSDEIKEGGENPGAGDSKPEPKAEPQVDWKAEAEKRAAELDKLKGEDKKRKDAAKRADEDKRAADGEAKKLYEEKSRELDEAKARAEALEGAARKRIDAQIARLPDDAQKRIALVKDALPLEKLGELVDAEAEAFGNTKAPPPATPAGKRQGGKRQLQARTYEKLDELGISPEVAERHVQVVETDLGGHVFKMAIKDVISKLQSIAVKSRPLSSDQYNREHQ